MRKPFLASALAAIFTLSACEDRSAPSGAKAEGSALESIPDASKEGIDKVKAWASDRLPNAEDSFADAEGSHFPSPDFWGKEIVYSIQVDRFNDGNPANNDPAPSESEWNRLPGLRHGGDLEGIEQRLDYLKDLGITTLWLTPIFKHNGSYHGYCATNPSDVDPGFGSREELRKLVKEAHNRNIKVVLDIVVNHLCDNKSSYVKHADHNRCANDLNAANWSGAGASSPSQGELAMGDSFFPAFRRPEFFNRCGSNSGEDTSGQGAETMYGDFSSGMFDYNTRNRDFQEIFTNLHKWWIAYADVDGFRLDAAKHVTEDYLAYFSTHIRDYAKTLGKDNFYIVGEVAASPDWSARRLGNMQTSPDNPSLHGNVPQSLLSSIWDLQPTYLSNEKARFPGMNAIYDFIFSGDSRDYLVGKSSGGRVENFYRSQDYQMLATQSDPRLNWKVLEIHDWPRIVSDTPDDLWKSKLAVSYLATVPGIPVIYYGMEQGFNGRCLDHAFQVKGAKESIQSFCKGGDDAMKRQDMFMGSPWRLGSTVPAIRDLAYVGPRDGLNFEGWQNDPMLSRSHEVYQTARRMNHLRSSCAPLHMGDTFYNWHEEGNSGILAFSRFHAGKEMLVVVNNSPVPLPIPNLTIKSAETFDFQNVEHDQEKARASAFTASFDGLRVEGNSVAVFAKADDLGPYDSDLKIRLCK